MAPEITVASASPQAVKRPADSGHTRPDASFKIKDSLRQVSRSQPVEKIKAVTEKQVQIDAREPFGEEKVMKALESYIAGHQPEPMISIALKTHRPLVKDEKVTILADNQLQLEKLEAMKQHLQNALMKALNNGHIVLDFRLFEDNITKEDKKLYTSSEKFEHFLRINPVVADLKNIFGLEIE